METEFNISLEYFEFKTNKVMKKKKIRNVDISVCCGEQVICYNICFVSEINFRKDVKKAFMFAEKFHFPEIPTRFNKDLIISLVENNLEKYMESPKIFSNYRDLGLFFPIP